MKHDVTKRTFYHVYPLGAAGAPRRNDFSSPPGGGLKAIAAALPRLAREGYDALYIGPLFESTAHGYDTLDYRWVDRRLGTNEDLKALVQEAHSLGIAVVLDAVLNHVGRHFFAFRDLRERGQDSPYRGWFKGVDFSRNSPLGDPFAYEGWSGHYDLVKLDTEHPEVRSHLFDAVRQWIEEFGIDGLRLDAADVLSPSFMDALSAFTASLKGDFWLMGEVVHGDYRTWAARGRLDSVTNYELYKGLWSSFKDRNFFEIAWSLNRQFGPEGLYRDIDLYNFADNHDVDRVASLLPRREHLFPLYGILFTVPGVPSVYYGSEWGIGGRRSATSDSELRPALDIAAERSPGDAGGDLAAAIARFIRLRREIPALRLGGYRQLHVSSEQLAYAREYTDAEGRVSRAVVAVNAAETAQPLTLKGLGGGWKDALDGNRRFGSGAGGDLNLSVPPSWLRLLVPED